MKTQTKFNICLGILSATILLNVFSNPLGIPEWGYWVVSVGSVIAIAMTLYYTKRLKQEKLSALISQESHLSVPAALASRKKTLIVTMILSSLVALCGPLWLPWTGTTLGPIGDFLTGMISAAVVCFVLGTQLRKLGKLEVKETIAGHNKSSQP